MNNLTKWILAIIGAGLLTYVGFWIYAIASLGGAFDTFYSTQDLIDNYNKKTTEIEDLKNYINEIVIPDKSVEIEFESNSRFFIFHVVDNGNNDSNWDLKVNSLKTDTLLQNLAGQKRH